MQITQSPLFLGTLNTRKILIAVTASNKYLACLCVFAKQLSFISRSSSIKKSPRQSDEFFCALSLHLLKYA